MLFRHELKYVITPWDRLELRQRLSVVMRPDPYAINGVNEIRSLYLDNIYDKALNEKIDGINIREKFRVRYYFGNTDFIRLEKKSKYNDLCNKQNAAITYEEAQAIATGDVDVLAGNDNPLVRELYMKMRCEGLRAKTIVDYTREPFVFAPGNVRVTLDYDIRTGILCRDFLNKDCVTVPVADSPVILEVKWDDYLPDVIKDIVRIPTTSLGSYSKYEACRAFG